MVVAKVKRERSGVVEVTTKVLGLLKVSQVQSPETLHGAAAAAAGSASSSTGPIIIPCPPLLPAPRLAAL